MLELWRPLSRVLNVPAILVQRLTAVMPRLDLRGIDPDHFVLSMAEADPDYLNYLDRDGRPLFGEREGMRR